MPKSRFIKLRLFVEGVETRVISVKRTTTSRSVPVADIEIPINDSIHNLPARTVIRVFMETEDTVIKGDPVESFKNSKVFFEGEFLGFDTNKTYNSRSMVLHCAASMNVFDFILLYFFGIGMSKNGQPSANTRDFVKSKIAATISGAAPSLGTIGQAGTLSNFFTLTKAAFDKVTNIADGVVAIFKRLMSTNITMAIFNFRYNYIDRIVSPVSSDGKPDQTLNFFFLDAKSFSAVANRVASTFGGTGTLRRLLQAVLDTAYFEINYRCDNIMNIILKPMLWWSRPPTCNILFPDDIKELHYSRNKMSEPTRQLSYVNIPSLISSRVNSLSSALSGIENRFWVTPSDLTQKLNQEKADAEKDPALIDESGILNISTGMNALTEEEFFKGIVPDIKQGDFIPAKLLSSNNSSKEDKDKKNTKKIADLPFVKYMQNINDYYYIQKQFSNRFLAASGPFAEEPLAGYNTLVLDANGSYEGYLISKVDVIHNSGLATSEYKFFAPRPLNEIALKGVPSYLDKDLYDDSFFDKKNTTPLEYTYRQLIEAQPGDQPVVSKISHAGIDSPGTASAQSVPLSTYAFSLLSKYNNARNKDFFKKNIRQRNFQRAGELFEFYRFAAAARRKESNSVSQHIKEQAKKLNEEKNSNIKDQNDMASIIQEISGLIDNVAEESAKIIGKKDTEIPTDIKFEFSNTLMILIKRISEGSQLAASMFGKDSSNKNLDIISLRFIDMLLIFPDRPTQGDFFRNGIVSDRILLNLENQYRDKLSEIRRASSAASAFESISVSASKKDSLKGVSSGSGQSIFSTDKLISDDILKYRLKDQGSAINISGDFIRDVLKSPINFDDQIGLRKAAQVG